MNISGVISQLISLFLMMLAGYIVARAGILTPDFRKQLSAFTLNTAAPCIIVASVLKSTSTPADMIRATGVSVIFFVIMILLAALMLTALALPGFAEEPEYEEITLATAADVAALYKENKGGRG